MWDDGHTHIEKWFWNIANFVKPGSSWGMARHKANRELTSSISVREDIFYLLNWEELRSLL
jgi:hypothetical protein